MQSLQATQMRQTELIETLADKVGRIEAAHADLAAGLNRFAAEQDGSLARHMEALARQLMAGIGSEQAALREAIAGMSRQNGENLRLLTSSQHQTALRLSEAIEMVSGDVARRAEAEASRFEAIRASGASSFEAASRAIAGIDAKQSSRLSLLEQDLARLAAGQEALTRTLAEELPRLAAASAPVGDAGVSDGLSRINETMDVALTAYSGLLHVALARWSAPTSAAGIPPNPRARRSRAPAPTAEAARRQERTMQLLPKKTVSSGFRLRMPSLFRRQTDARQRRHERYSCSIPATMQVVETGARFEGLILEISTGGCSFRVASMYLLNRVGTSVTIGTDLFQLPGIIRATRSHSYGVQFLRDVPDAVMDQLIASYGRKAAPAASVN